MLPPEPVSDPDAVPADWLAEMLLPTKALVRAVPGLADASGAATATAMTGVAHAAVLMTARRLSPAPTDGMFSVVMFPPRVR